MKAKKMKQTVDFISGILFGKAQDTENARRISDFFSRCPFTVTSTYTKTAVIALLTFPGDHKWWFDSIAAHPKETVGLETAEVVYPKYMNAHSPWSEGKVKPHAEQPPCGADCQRCPVYSSRCPGCPATRYYSPRKNISEQK